MSDWENFVHYSALADQLTAAATKEQLAETARLLALNVAHLKSRSGEAPTEDLNEMLRAGQVNPDSAAMLADGMEHFVGVLASMMGLDAPEKLN